MFFQKIKDFFGLKTDKWKGSVIFFSRRKGYGFIKADQVGKDVFVHQSDLDDKINKGDRVAFQVKTEDKGLRAVSVERLG